MPQISVEIKISHEEKLPKGVKIIQIMQDAQSPLYIGLADDNRLYAYYNGEWCIFINVLTSTNMEEETTPVEETAAEGTESTETSEVAADEAQVEKTDESSEGEAEEAEAAAE